MKKTKREQMHAERVSAAVDQLISDSEARLEAFDLADDGVLATAQQLARLPGLLGPVDPALEQRVMQKVQMAGGQRRKLPHFRPAWAVLGLAAILLAVMLFTPLGQTAVASFMAVFSLGRTEVRITPVDTPAALAATSVAEGSAIRESLTLEQAQTQIPFELPQPAYLPDGYHLGGVSSYTYPDLPTWIKQPLFAELRYLGDEGGELVLRVYPILLGDEASISGLNLQAAPIRDVQDVDVNGQPGVLLQLGTEHSEAGWQEVVWEQHEMVLSLSAVGLGGEDLLRIARSVH